MQNPRQGPPRSPGGLPDATLSPKYLGASLQPEPTTALFTLYYNATVTDRHIYTFSEMRAGQSPHPASSEGLHLQVPHMYLHGSLL